jgi:glycosyltransferase involved in cell wall biosynthesis
VANIPVVTIVIPVYNMERFLADTLASVTSQSFDSWEAIVVDDGSSDQTADLVLKFARADSRISLINQTRLGVSAARNRGLADARGEYVMFLDGDDLLHKTALQRLTEALKSDPAAQAVFGVCVHINEAGDLLPKQRSPQSYSYPSGDLLEYIIRDNPFANGGQILLRTNIGHRTGGFSTQLRLSEDWEYWCRLALEGPLSFIGGEAEILRLRVRAGSTAPSLSRDWQNHQPAIDAVLSNPKFAARFSDKAWTQIVNTVWASHLFEAGRINFVSRQYRDARRLMLQSLRRQVTPKRLVLFALTQAQQITGRTIVNRLRFLDETAA